MKKVIISNLASLENKQNVEYLFNHFGKEVALNYLDKFDKAISLLEKRLYAGKYDEKLKLRRFIISEEIYIVYDHIQFDTFLIVCIWNNKNYPYWF